jgi:hypothetical protein
MARRTKKQSKKGKQGKQGKQGNQSKQNHIMTIPELRRSFEHIETFVHQHKRSKDLVKMLQEEWLKVFKKKLDKESASAFVNHTVKESGMIGGGGQLTGAPLDYTMRPGLYISPGIDQGSYARVPNYVSSGFWNPEPGQSYDRVIGQTVYPDRTPAGLGDNTVIGLKIGGGGNSSSRKTKKNKRKQSGGDPLRTLGTALNQFLFRPIDSTSPPSVAQDVLTASKGESLGPSPLSYQNKLDYQMGPRLHSGNLQISPIEAKLPINIKNP